MTKSRSEMMRAVKSRNTTPELIVRRILREIGLSGYRLHRKDLPGKLDIAYVGRRKAIFINGCFWHGHTCPKGKMPKTNVEFWMQKLKSNVERDVSNAQKLENLGWTYLVIWECELKTLKKVIAKLENFLLKN